MGTWGAYADFSFGHSASAADADEWRSHDSRSNARRFRHMPSFYDIRHLLVACPFRIRDYPMSEDLPTRI